MKVPYPGLYSPQIRKYGRTSALYSPQGLSPFLRTTEKWWLFITVTTQLTSGRCPPQLRAAVISAVLMEVAPSLQRATDLAGCSSRGWRYKCGLHSDGVGCWQLKQWHYEEYRNRVHSVHGRCPEISCLVSYTCLYLTACSGPEQRRVLLRIPSISHPACWKADSNRKTAGVLR